MSSANSAASEAPRHLKSQTLHHHLVLGLGTLLLLLSAVLAAQPAARSALPIKEPTPITGDCLSNKKSDQLLPVLPRRATEGWEGEELVFSKGVSRSAPASGLRGNPDELKALRGYSGPYYNIENLDGKVVVLESTVYEWPQELWRATGMVRNQSCASVKITSVSAQLLGVTREQPLEVVVATLPVNELRPGEPVPFAIEAATQSADVRSVEWHVEYELLLTAPSRDIRFEIYEAKQVPGAKRYSLFGAFDNIGDALMARTRVIAAWIDSQGRVINIGSPRIRLITDPTQERNTIDLGPGDSENFHLSINDPLLAETLGEASVALWGVSN